MSNIPNNLTVIDTKPENLKVVDIKPNNLNSVDVKPENFSVFDYTIIYSAPYNLLAGQWIPLAGFTYPNSQSGTTKRP